MTSFEQQDVQGVRVLCVSGSLTQEGVDKIGLAFEAALPDGVRAVVDLARVDLITTPGLALVVAATKRLSQTSGRLVFAGVKAGVRNLLRRCRLDEVLELAGDRDQSVQQAKT